MRRIGYVAVIDAATLAMSVAMICWVFTLQPAALAAHTQGNGPHFPGDDSAFIKDVTYPDDTVVKHAQVLKKTWRIKNTGTVTWENRWLTVQFESQKPGEEKLSTRDLAWWIPTTHPGETRDVTVELVVTSRKKGVHTAYFKMSIEKKPPPGDARDGVRSLVPCFPHKLPLYARVIVK